MRLSGTLAITMGANSVATLRAEIADAMLRDRHMLSRRLDRARSADDLSRVARDVARSRKLLHDRARSAPRPTYPEDLPVAVRKDEIARAIEQHQVVVVCGETGSGKTTQLPKICLELGRGVAGMIGHTQPRRIAARTLAARIANELESEVGGAVGYKVRFTDKVGDRTYVKLMTDGILLAETATDRFLDAYDTIIVDEAHERSLNIDFLLGYIKRLLPKRPDLKVIVTSATIDPELFSKHFGGAPICEVSGRVYPVEIRHRPLATEEPDEQDLGMDDAIANAVDELSAEGRGDILVFLPGERDIREAAETLRRRELDRTQVVPLYARLSAGEQGRVFAPHHDRHIVLATNVAETSLTVPGVKYVIDTGLARISHYDPRRKVQRLPIERIARASAAQRSGRCGRTSDGICIRLYSEEDDAARAEFTPPEIQRTNLAAVILRMAAAGLGDIEQFPFVEPPDTRAVRDGYQTLIELGALDEEYRLTRVGRMLGRLPTDPRIGRMILAGHDHGCLREILVVAAALETQDPRQRPFDAEQKADEAQRPFRDEDSDFLGILKLWDAYHEREEVLSKNQLRRWCEEHFVSYLRMREWIDVHDQLSDLAREIELSESRAPASYAALHRALLTGLLSNVALRTDERTYVGARNMKMVIFPGSGLAKKRPEWIVAGEIVETDRLFARTVAKIDPSWIEPLADHLVGRAHFEPHWDLKRGQVLAFERVTLFGLPIVEKRRVDFGRIDPEEAREIFIREALVHGQLAHAPGFLRHNMEQIESVRSLEARARRRDLCVDESTVHALYEPLVPPEVHTAAAFERHRKDVEAKDPGRFLIRREDLIASDPDCDYERAFPTMLAVGRADIPLSYRFAPGDPDDGVTATVPLAMLHLLAPERFEWLVPGLLADKIAALIESLPRAQKKSLPPVREHAQWLARELRPEGGLFRALATHLGVSPEMFRAQLCPEHLSMLFCVVDETGKPVGTSRDLAELVRGLRVRGREAFSRAVAPHQRHGLRSWDIGTYQETLELASGGVVLTVFPAVVDEGDSVSLLLYDDATQAGVVHRGGVRRLLALRLADTLKTVKKSLPGFAALSLGFAVAIRGDVLKDDIVLAAVDRACLERRALPRTKAELEKRADETRGRVAAAADAIARKLEPIAAEWHAVATVIARRAGGAAAVREHVTGLVYPGFVVATPEDRLLDLPRYLKAARLRLERTGHDPAKDRERAATLAKYVERIVGYTGAPNAELERYRWMVEELAVSLFAQELRTKEAVSPKRLDEQWERVVSI